MFPELGVFTVFADRRSSAASSLAPSDAPQRVLAMARRGLTTATRGRNVPNRRSSCADNTLSSPEAAPPLPENPELRATALPTHQHSRECSAEYAPFTGGTLSLEDLRSHVRALGYEPIDPTEEVKASVGTITVPVFGRGGGVAMMLTVYGLPEATRLDLMDAYVERMLTAGQRATRLVGGASPAIA